jgi:hypothetical protein
VHNRFKNNGEDPKKSFDYVMDKILWPRVHNKDILREVPLKIIVILRNPKAALPSILSRNLDGIQTPEEALRYYSKSLKRTSRNLEVYGSPFVIVKYEDLTDRTEKTLKKLYQYLGIKGSLKPEYKTMWATGEKGIGDSSENIHSGKIVSSTSSYEMEIEKKVLREARKKYDQFLNSWNVENK